MADAHFISYSSADAPEFALKLANALTAGPPSFPVWLDRCELRPGDDWDSPSPHRRQRRFALQPEPR